VDRAAPGARATRRDTYQAWILAIEDWAKRTGRELHHQQSAIWAMLLGYRLYDDGSDVSFFQNKVIDSPWKRGGHVIIEVVEDDLPESMR